MDRLEEASRRVNEASKAIGASVDEIESNGEVALRLAAENSELLGSFGSELAHFRGSKGDMSPS
jgi:hypothetical protein